MEPGDISQILQIQPTLTRRTGDYVKILDKLADYAVWRVSSKKNINSIKLEEHLSWLFVSLTGKDEVLRTLRESGHRCYVACYWLAAGENTEPRMRFQQMKRLAELELDFQFDIYCEGR
jgi:hypothetical protein